MRSYLYCPGNNPKMIINAGLYGADGLVFDLEDAVAPEKKQEARILLSQAFSEQIVPVEKSVVRINGPESDLWEKDLKELIPAGVRVIRIPKVENSNQVQEISGVIERIESENAVTSGAVVLQCILETPLGVENVFLIGDSSSRICSFSFGAEDYCNALGIQRGQDLLPLDYPRSRIASAAAAFGYSAYDTVWGFLDDETGLKADAVRAKSLGFVGKSLIHPDQIDIVNKVFSPTSEELADARSIFEKAGLTDGGATAVNGRMVDRPVLQRAEKTIRLAEEYGVQVSKDDK
ncbi:MAG: citrate lyase subunit beta [Spirochaetes bacterium]|nr:MAG: citrate lyase subunit beta [Spirochaetota bacterium]